MTNEARSEEVSKSHIIVPCKNEAGNIPNLVEDFLKHRHHEDRLWLVEGGSSDNTREECLQIAGQESSIEFLPQAGRGKFGGVRTVIHHLLESGERGTVAIWDADHSIMYCDVQRAMALSSSSNSFIFTERIGAQIEKGAMPLINNVGNRVIAWIAGFVYGIKIKDALSGTKIFPLSFFSNIEDRNLFDFLQKDTYGDLSYFLLAKVNHSEMYSISVNYYARKYGVSGLNRLANGIELLQNLNVSRNIIKKIGKNHV